MLFLYQCLGCMADLSSAVHNPNVTDVGREEARTKLEDMGGKIEEPAD